MTTEHVRIKVMIFLQGIYENTRIGDGIREIAKNLQIEMETVSESINSVSPAASDENNCSYPAMKGTHCGCYTKGGRCCACGFERSVSPSSTKEEKMNPNELKILAVPLETQLSDSAISMPTNCAGDS